MNILPSLSAFLALSLLLVFCQLVSVSSWMPNPKPKHSAFPHQFPYASITMLAVTSADEDSSQGSLLVSNMHKIGLSTDKASKLRLLLASQSPRRREILVSRYLVGKCFPLIEPKNKSSIYKFDNAGHDGARRAIYRRTISTE